MFFHTGRGTPLRKAKNPSKLMFFHRGTPLRKVQKSIKINVFFLGVPLYEKSKNRSKSTFFHRGTHLRKVQKSIKIWAKLKVNLKWMFDFFAQKYPFYHLFPLIQEMWKNTFFHFFVFCDLKKVQFSKVTKWWFSNIWSFRRRRKGGCQIHFFLVFFCNLKNKNRF